MGNSIFIPYGRYHKSEGDTMSQTENKLEIEITKKVRMKYLLHLPDRYEKESSIKVAFNLISSRVR